MDWFREVNAYCERTDAAYWAEPVNALSNASFFVAAFLCWRMLEGTRDAGARALAVVLLAIGIGSWLFHTHAQVWAAVADVVPIQVFILGYLYLATVRFFARPWWAGALAVGLFVPYSIVTAQVVAAVFGPLNSSVGYVPVPILIAAYGAALWRRSPDSAIGLWAGAGMLAVSLFFRTIDQAVCDAFPIGTHWVWHLLNGVMLGWMILVLHRHGPRPAASAALARSGRGR
jgi:hypothetical protein